MPHLPFTLCICSILYKTQSEAWCPPPSFRSTVAASRASSSKAQIGPQQLGEFETLAVKSTEISKRKVALIDYSNSGSSIPFQKAWDWQKEILNDHVERITEFQSSSIDDEKSFSQFWNPTENNKYGIDSILMLQHEPIYTLGTGSDEKFVLGRNDSDSSLVPVVRIDRGGEVTYHGPGQLTVYPILDLRGYKQDIHWYMRALEEAILVALHKCGLSKSAERQADVTGVWVENHKVAACGVKVKRWITMHGLAVNVEKSSLKNFDGIVPCGLDGRKVGCINQFVNDREFTVAEFAEIMKEALEEVFEIQLVPITHSLYR